MNGRTTTSAWNEMLLAPGRVHGTRAEPIARPERPGNTPQRLAAPRVESTKNESDAREEFKTICEFLRGYSTLRFYQLALLLGTSGSIATALSNPALREYPYGHLLLRATGLAIALALTVMEFRASSYWHHMRDRANALCDALRYARFPTGSRWSPLTTTGAGFYLHAFIVGGWMIALMLHVRGL